MSSKRLILNKNLIRMIVQFFQTFKKNNTSSKTETLITTDGHVSNTWSCSLFCSPGTTKILNKTTVTSCCTTNNCNNGPATADTNTLWCIFGQKGSQSIGEQSCPSDGSCGVNIFNLANDFHF